MRFTGKTVLVTGAANGIGRAAALQFAREGAALAVTDVDEEALETLRGDLEAVGAETLAVVCDVSDEAAVHDVVSRILLHFGKIDALINNAGIYREAIPPEFVDSKSTQWRRKIEVNVLGTMYMTQAVLPDMLRRGYGRVVNLASVAGVYGIRKMVDYSMTKGAILGFTKALAKEVAPKGVTVNAVSPGSINVSGKPEHDLPDYSFLGRSGTPEECAAVIVFLSSDEASYVSGQNWQVDGCRKMM